MFIFFSIFVLFVTSVHAVIPNAGFTPLDKGDLIVIHSSSLYSPTKLPHIPIPQTYPPECPPPKDIWHDVIDGEKTRRTSTNSDHQTQLTMFRRGLNHTLGQFLLGSNVQVSPYFMETGIDRHTTTACQIKFGNAKNACEHLTWIKNYRMRSTWYLDGIPCSYTPLEQHHIDPNNIQDITDNEHDDPVDEFIQDMRREVYRDLDSFEIGFPAVPYDQHSSDRVAVWTHHHIRVYYKEQEDEIYAITGCEVVPSSPKTIPCHSETIHSYNITYTVTWFRNMASADARAKLYLFRPKNRSEIEVGGVAASIFGMIMVCAFALSWIRYNIARELKDQSGTIGIIGCSWKSISNDVFRPPRYYFLWASFMGIGAHILSLAIVSIVVTMLFSFYDGSATSIAEMLLLTSSALYVVNGTVTVFALRYATRISTSTHGDLVGPSKLETINSIITPKGTAPSILYSLLGSSGVLLIFYAFYQMIMEHFESTAFIGWYDTFVGFVLWFSMALLGMMGGSALGWSLSAYPLKLTTPVNQIERAILALPIKGFGAALLAICICIVSSISGIGIFLTAFQSSWGQYVYAMYGTTIIVCTCYMGICVCGAAVYLYQILKWEDWRWWWQTPIVGGSSAGLLFLVLLFYIKVLSNVDDQYALTLMVIEAFVFSSAVFFVLFFVTGSCSFLFVHELYKIGKRD